MRTIIVCGGRSYNNKERVFSVLDELHMSSPIEYLINGGAKGADSLSSLWARTRKVTYIEVLPDWKRLGKFAGPHRNREMLRIYEPSLVVAFPGGKGTQDMCTIARAAGVTVIKHDP
jgi:hypothetical protein